MKQELDKPDGAENAEAIELVRAWISEGNLCVSMRSGVAETPEDWGDIICVLAQYADLILHQDTECGVGASIEKIRTRFNQMLDNAPIDR
jgi:hypothetical protein